MCTHKTLVFCSKTERKKMEQFRLICSLLVVRDTLHLQVTVLDYCNICSAAILLNLLLRLHPLCVV